MAILKININGAKVPIGMWAVPAYDNQVRINFDNLPNSVSVSGLADWADWQTKFIQTLATLNGDNQTEADKITFETI
jgi:hypothetical protein